MPPKPIYANHGPTGPARSRRPRQPADCHSHARRHRPHRPGQLRIDGLAKPVFPVWRTKDHIHKDGYWLICDPKVVYRHWRGDYGGLECLDAPYSNKTLHDGSSRLVAKTIAHFAS